MGIRLLAGGVFVGCASVAGLNDFEIVPCPTVCDDASVVDGSRDAAPDDGPAPSGDDDDVVAPTDSGADVVTPPAKPTTLTDGLSSVVSIAVAPDAIYLATPLGTKRVTLANPSATPALISEVSASVHALAWDATDGALLWVDDSSIDRWTPGAPGLNTDGHSGEPHGVDVIYTNGRAIAAYDTKVTSYQVEPTFQDIHDLAMYPFPNPRCLATDGTSVFWLDNVTLNKSGLTGSQFPYNGGSFANATSLAVDTSNVYIAESDAIGSIPKGLAGGATVTKIISGLTKPFSLLLDGTSLYWLTSSGSLQRGSTTGGAAVTLATGGAIDDTTHTRLIGVDASYIYWANPTDGTLNRIAK